MWFRVPNQIYFNRNAIENLGQFFSASTVIVSNSLLEKAGAERFGEYRLDLDRPVEASIAEARARWQSRLPAPHERRPAKEA